MLAPTGQAPNKTFRHKTLECGIRTPRDSAPYIVKAGKAVMHNLSGRLGDPSGSIIYRANRLTHRAIKISYNSPCISCFSCFCHSTLDAIKNMDYA